MFSRKSITTTTLLTILTSIVGCGGGASDAPTLYSASGVVKYKGAPVPSISVAFIPEGGAGLAAEGTTDSEGKFVLATNSASGAKAGTYNVALVHVPDEVPDMFASPEKSKADEVIPKKYGDPKTSDLKATVSEDESKNTYTFELE
ncbi:MAG: Ig-like domain-containing protein [Planctomycetaceae bacterium]|nr:Ig-like domain-containing protein [Planctomycetaceae bacterium]